MKILLLACFVFCLFINAGAQNVIATYNNGQYDLKNKKTGELIKRYASVSRFIDGIARVSELATWRSGFINDDGVEFVSCGKYKYIEDFRWGRASVANENGFHGLIDRNGKEITGLKYKRITYTRLPGVFVYTLNKKHGLLDTAGREFVAAEYDELTACADDVPAFRCKKDDKYGVVNSQGIEIVPPVFDEVGDFYQNIVRTKKDGKYGYVFLNGKEITAPRFQSADHFINTYVVAKENNKEFEITPQGEIKQRDVVPTTSAKVVDMLDELELKDFWFKKTAQGKYVITQLNKKDVRLTYDSIAKYSEEIYYAWEGTNAVVYAKTEKGFIFFQPVSKTILSLVHEYNIRHGVLLVAILKKNHRYGLYDFFVRNHIPEIFTDYRFNVSGDAEFSYASGWYKIADGDKSRIELTANCDACKGAGKFKGKTEEIHEKGEWVPEQSETTVTYKTSYETVWDSRTNSYKGKNTRTPVSNTKITPGYYKKGKKTEIKHPDKVCNDCKGKGVHLKVLKWNGGTYTE